MDPGVAGLDRSCRREAGSFPDTTASAAPHAAVSRRGKETSSGVLRCQGPQFGVHTRCYISCSHPEDVAAEAGVGGSPLGNWYARFQAHGVEGLWESILEAISDSSYTRRGFLAQRWVAP